jgi:hypothetical protein
MMRNSDFAMAMAMENEELGFPVVLPPPMRVIENHGNAKRNRKKKDKSVRNIRRKVNSENVKRGEK